MRLLTVIVLFLLLAVACQKKENDSSTVPPVDSTAKPPYPDTLYYTGWLSAGNTLDELCERFDTTYVATLAVCYPDSFHVNFKLNFWDCAEASYPDCNAERFIFMQDDLYEIDSTGKYLTSRFRYYTSYSVTADSLIIMRTQGTGGHLYYHYLTFRGKKL